MSNLLARFYPEARFGGFSDVDGTVRFYTRVSALLEPAFVVLDVGCGRGAHRDDPVPFRRKLRILQGRCRRVIGIDADAEAAENPLLDEFRLLSGETWPVDDAGADLVLADFVLEHVARPEVFFGECARALRPGGYLCLRTPNAWAYESLCARLLPRRWHAPVLHTVQSERSDRDVFPKFYRCNTSGKLRRMMRRHGFEACVSAHSAEPSYLAFSPIAYALGVMYHRLTPGCLRSNLLAFGRKDGP